MSTALPVLFAFALALGPATAAAAEFRFDAGNSELAFEGDYGGEGVPGVFRRFSGSAVFDPADPAATRFTVEVEVASLDTDYADRDEVLRDADWFDAAAHPQARWVSSGPCSVDGAALACPGELSLKGVTRPAPLAIRIAAPATLEGSATLARREFGIGGGPWDEDGTIGETVAVRFRLALMPR